MKTDAVLTSIADNLEALKKLQICRCCVTGIRSRKLHLHWV